MLLELLLFFVRFLRPIDCSMGDGLQNKTFTSTIIFVALLSDK